MEEHIGNNCYGLNRKIRNDCLVCKILKMKLCTAYNYTKGEEIFVGKEEELFGIQEIAHHWDFLNDIILLCRSDHQATILGKVECFPDHDHSSFDSCSLCKKEHHELDEIFVLPTIGGTKIVIPKVDFTFLGSLCKLYMEAYEKQELIYIANPKKKEKVFARKEENIKGYIERLSWDINRDELYIEFDTAPYILTLDYQMGDMIIPIHREAFRFKIVK